MMEEEKYYTNQVVKMLWRMVNAAFADAEGGESLSFSEKELLEDVLRFESLTKIAKLKHVAPATVSNRFQTVMDKVEKRILTLQDKSLMLSVTSKDLIIERNAQVIKRQKEEIRQLQGQIEKENAEKLDGITNLLKAKLKIASNEAADLSRELLVARNEIKRLKLLVPTQTLPASTKAPAPKYLSDYQSTLLSSGIEVLRLRNEMVDHLNKKGIVTVYDLVAIPRRNLSKFMPQGWRKTINDILERHNLSLAMSIILHPDINKYEKKD